MLHLKNINVHVNHKHILNNISTSIQTGDFVTIVGPNGVGKTTLFDAIAGKITPTTGQICINGHDVTKLNEVQRATLVGRLFQNPRLNTVDTMTVKENMALAALKAKSARLTNLKPNLPHHINEHILKQLNGTIESLLTTKMGSLSGGQRQMIAMVMALICPPKILLLDEPTAALDPQAATKVLMFIAQIIKQQGITTLLITHDQNIATSLGNKLWILKNGTIAKELSQEKRTTPINHLLGEIDYTKLAEITA